MFFLYIHKNYLRSVSKCPIDTCFFYIPPSINVAAAASSLSCFQVFRFVVTRSQLSKTTKNLQGLPYGVSCLVPCQNLGFFCCNDLKPTINERLIKNEYELERPANKSQVEISDF